MSGDIIIEHAQNTFDEVGTAVSVASFMRLNDASTTTTGALTSSNARIMYTAVWSDGIDRQIAFANYAAAASFTRPNTPPSSSRTVDTRPVESCFTSTALTPSNILAPSSAATERMRS